MSIGGVLLGILAVAGVIGTAVAVAIIFAIIYSVRRGYYALKGEPYKPLLPAAQREYEHQDVDAGATAKSISNVLKHYVRADIVGPYAKAGVAALVAADRKAASFRAVLDNKFQPNTITWHKFATAADSMQQAVLRNCAELANRVQVFDATGYRQVDRVRKSSNYRPQSAPPDTLAIEKSNLLSAALAELDGIVAANDRLLLEIDKLAAELGTLEDAGSGAESDRIVEEIRTLIDETKYYRQGLDDMR